MQGTLNNTELNLMHQLMIQSYFIKDIGLLHGQMGLSICFHLYGQYLKEPVFNEIGNDLLDVVWDNINTDVSLNFDSGLCGIGWGIEYLIQNKFVNGSSNEICSEIDRQIRCINLKMLDISSEYGKGILLYIQSRTAGKNSNHNRELWSDDFMTEYDVIKNNTPWLHMNPFLLIKKDLSLHKIIASNHLGLNAGIGGFLLQTIQEQHRTGNHYSLQS